jgi:hypothetical protein
MNHLLRLFVTAAFLVSFSSAHADDYLTIGAGWFDFNRSDDSSLNFSGEWRGNQLFYDLRPVVGVTANTDGGVYGYAGFDYDWEFMPHWAIIPGLDIGAWHQGSSIDLGGTFEFHESMELDYKFDGGYRVGAQIAHTSNASIYENNPGVNTLMGTFSFPL